MGNRPFILQAAYKDYLWGGSRLRDDYGQVTDVEPLAEAWVCSTHPEGSSEVVCTGLDSDQCSTEVESGQSIAESAGSVRSLRELLDEHPEYMGTHPREIMRGVDGATSDRGGLPILVKLIDARSDLSVQVHPDDEYAFTHECGQSGKTELWYVLHAKPGASLVYGFNRDVTSGIVRDAVADGSIGRYLQYVPVEKDDVFFVEPGTVHAIGSGIVIAEIQQSSNLTYRLYDYDRVDRFGHRRELHIEKALDVLRFESSARPRQPMRVLNYRNGYAAELLGRCRYFQVERMLLNTGRHRQMADYQTGSNSFRVLLCVDGCGTMFGDGVMINFFQGDCIFVPADSVSLKLHGQAQLLDVGC